VHGIFDVILLFPKDLAVYAFCLLVANPELIRVTSMTKNPELSRFGLFFELGLRYEKSG